MAKIGGVNCGSCGVPLEEPTNTPLDQRSPCPRCGSTLRRISVLIQATVTAHATLEGKKRPAGGGSPTVRFKIGADLWRRFNRWMHKERYIDRENDRYRERVVDPETGKVVHDCDEPLSQHQRHGSAKKKGP